MVLFATPVLSLALFLLPSTGRNELDFVVEDVEQFEQQIKRNIVASVLEATDHHNTETAQKMASGTHNKSIS
jgi:hypothetical protein